MNNTVMKSFEILQLISGHREGLTLAQIVRTLDLPKSTVFNIVHTLEHLGVLTASGDKLPVYRLGIEALKLGLSYLSSTNLDAAARPVLSRLCRETNETVFMSVRSGPSDLVYIMKYLSDAELQTIYSVGAVRPLLSVAMGKAMLSAMTDREVAELATPELFACSNTPSISDLTSLQACLEEARRLGYVIDATAENPSYAATVAAPVLDVNNQLAGAISIVILRNPDDQDRIGALGQQVNTAALEISRGLGYLRPELYSK